MPRGMEVAEGIAAVRSADSTSRSRLSGASREMWTLELFSGARELCVGWSRVLPEGRLESLRLDLDAEASFSDGDEPYGLLCS